MSEEPEESDNEQRKKFSLKNLQLDRRFMIVSIIMVISIVTIAFSTKNLFETNLRNWTINRGAFEGTNGALTGATININWAYHESTTAYGVWEWSFRYYGHGSASVIFIGLNQDPNLYSHSMNGYKLELEVQKPLSLQRIDGESITVLNSIYHPLDAQSTYRIKVIRSLENNFTIFVNDEYKFSAIDDTYTTSEAFELDWVNKQTLNWVLVTDSEEGGESWFDYFTGMPTANSTNFFTKVALYAPFVALGLVVLFYVFRLLLTEGSWTRFLVPLLLAIIIGVGVGYLFEFLRTVVPDPAPNTNTIVTTDTNGSAITSPITSPGGNDTNGGGTGVSPFIPPIEKKPVSIALLVVSGIFILLMISFVMIDFFRKREEEYHEQIIQKDVRWLPKATEADHRKRVIRAYHKASYDIIDHGVKSDRSMTPGEFEDVAKEKFELPDDSIDSLTDLYEEARFSEHEIESDKSEKAEKYFGKISQTLKERFKPKKSETDQEEIESEEIEERD
ncbi:MAG TPA: DUF4129 domain-containing protein [candidate division Zixibacteria bacterium]|nr:DUF4129 domain-containing protein [candidate division Zixibacteria bacterium]